jgi:hypothetical protein
MPYTSILFRRAYSTVETGTLVPPPLVLGSGLVGSGVHTNANLAQSSTLYLASSRVSLMNRLAVPVAPES